MLCAFTIGLMPFVENNQWRKRPERIAQRSFDLPAPKTALLLVGVQIQEAFKQSFLLFNVVIGGKKS